MRAGNAGSIKGGGWTEGLPQLSEMMIKVGYGALQVCKIMEGMEGLQAVTHKCVLVLVFHVCELR